MSKTHTEEKEEASKMDIDESEDLAKTQEFDDSEDSEEEGEEKAATKSAIVLHGKTNSIEVTTKEFPYPAEAPKGATLYQVKKNGINKDRWFWAIYEDDGGSTNYFQWASTVEGNVVKYNNKDGSANVKEKRARNKRKSLSNLKLYQKLKRRTQELTNIAKATDNGFNKHMLHFVTAIAELQTKVESLSDTFNKVVLGSHPTQQQVPVERIRKRRKRN